VSNWFKTPTVILLVLLFGFGSAVAQERPDKHAQEQKLDRQFQAAVAQFDQGHFTEAAEQFEQILPFVPKSFEVQEMLGLAYASLSEDGKAIDHLEAAVRLKPDSPEFRTNLGTSLFHAGKKDSAVEQFQKAVSLAPDDYSTNHNLGEFYIEIGKISEAQPFLGRAQKIKPSYENGYDLAQADLSAGPLDEARSLVQALIQTKDAGELHNLLAQIEEKDGKFVAAVNEFEKAAHLDPSEDNLFDWGGELLLHRTNEPATQVFQEATRRFPKSPRLQIGLGMSFYTRGMYEEAVRALLAATDLGVTDPRCYLFLSKAYDSSPGQAEDVIKRFQRYAELQPDNALAQFYYAMSLWKGKRIEDAELDLAAVESLLKKAIALDGSLAEPHMQLGSLYADQHEYEKSIPEFVRALELDPNLPDAHYRLGTDYVHTKQKESAQKEFALYEKLRADHLAEVDKERAAVQQFVYSSKPETSSKP
jgi:tetratricopeptide (TPR) repeat protein